MVTINPRSFVVTDKYEYLLIGMLLQLYEGPKPGPMKVVVYSRNHRNTAMRQNTVVFEYGISGSSTCVGHCNSAYAASVGAASYLQTPAFGITPPIIQPYSSFGGTPILFDNNSNRLSQSIIRQQPRFVGPDGTLISFPLYNDPTTINNSNNRFYGTSAAVAHVAGVAALLLQGLNKSTSTSTSTASSLLLPNDIYQLLQDTAIDMNSTAIPNKNSISNLPVNFDYNTGYGYINTTKLFEIAKIILPSSPSSSKCNSLIGCRLRCFLARFGIGNAVCK